MSKKKSPGPAIVRGMKPWRGFCVQPKSNRRTPIAFHERDTFFDRTGAVPVLVTELGHHPADEAIERVRTYCRNAVLHGSIAYAQLARDILSILPPAKKGTR